MKNNMWNRIRLAFHCLIHFHQECLIGGGSNPEIGCWDCNYGEIESKTFIIGGE